MLPLLIFFFLLPGYRQRLGRFPTPTGSLLPTFLSDRIRKRRAFADRELETALPPTLFLQHPDEHATLLRDRLLAGLPLTLLPLVQPPQVNLWPTPCLQPAPTLTTHTNPNSNPPDPGNKTLPDTKNHPTPKTKPKISFSVESIIGVKWNFWSSCLHAGRGHKNSKPVYFDELSSFRQMTLPQQRKQIVQLRTQHQRSNCTSSQQHIYCCFSPDTISRLRNMWTGN